MCGRYTLTEPGAILEELGLEPPLDLAPRYNVAPTDPMPVVLIRDGHKVAEIHRWGLVPSWSEKPGKPLINARAETAARRPAFRDAMARRRCLVPADGFIEWRRDGKRRLPHWIRPAGGGAMTLAGIWERWKGEGASDWLLSFAILTGPANDAVGAIHDRMPIVVAPGDRDRWIEPELPVDALEDILAPAPDAALEIIPVSERINSVRHDDPECLRPPGGQIELF
jgi:putative SOS response-associated peptidase YedK